MKVAGGGLIGGVLGATAETRSLAATQSDDPALASLTREERLERFVHQTRHRSQMAALPSAIPGEEDRFVREPSGLQGLQPKAVFTYNPPTENPMTYQDGLMAIARGPVFISYGPALTDGDFYIDEWESFMYCSDDTLYNNQYLMLLRFEGDELAEFHLHEDSMHVDVTYGKFGPSKAVPVKEPRWPFRMTSDEPPKPGEIRAPFAIVEQFDLSPSLIRDVVPTGGAPAMAVAAGREGNRALVQGLREALAAGNQGAVNSFFGKGYRHFIAGDRPFGWDRLPLQEIYAPLVEHMASPLTLRYGPVIADETRAAEQMMSFAWLDDGTVFQTWHAFIHEIRGGKIVQTREYLDNAYVWGALGRWAAWGATPPKAPSVPRRSNLQGIAMTVNYANNETPDDFERFNPLPPLA